jgi:hypothetical protein
MIRDKSRRKIAGVFGLALAGFCLAPLAYAQQVSGTALIRHAPVDLAQERKSADWKAALAATMKARTTVTNRWLGAALNMGGSEPAGQRLEPPARPRSAAQAELSYKLQS